MIMKNRLSVVITMFSLMAFSCVNNKGVVCTMEYRMLTVSIVDSVSKPVVLDKYFVKKTATGQVLDYSRIEPTLDSINRIRGIYFVITDSQFNLTNENGDEFVFHGIRDSLEVVTEKYILGNDGCHVQMLSGKKTIVTGR